MRSLTLAIAIGIVVYSSAQLIEGERCNDAILFDIIKEFSFLEDPLEVRMKIAQKLQEKFPTSLSMGAICTDRVFHFPGDVNRRFCTVAFPNFKCHAIILLFHGDLQQPVMKSALVFLLFSISFSICCDFKVIVMSETHHEIWAQFTFFNKSLSEPLRFEKLGQKKELQVVGTMCSLAPTILKTYGESPTPTSKLIGSTQAHLEGINGTMTYKIFKNAPPSPVGPVRMLCSFGQCRSGK
ncbi:unnamed protein product [Caenorhabditis auriculariae]|uniref:Ground-like domain-containing protein n=1 Tax=Caenorhabditis auriculariae TaxID=2777116 RepID=A0A8S1H954_9PELO|nr:unnamed protein product [Caenorhabditis auriculariae]